MKHVQTVEHGVREAVMTTSSITINHSSQIPTTEYSLGLLLMRYSIITNYNLFLSTIKNAMFCSANADRLKKLK